MCTANAGLAIAMSMRRARAFFPTSCCRSSSALHMAQPNPPTGQCLPAQRASMSPLASATLGDKIKAEMGPLTKFLEDDHRRLEALLERADTDVAAYEEFREGLLRHIAMEE